MSACNRSENVDKSERNRSPLESRNVRIDFRICAAWNWSCICRFAAFVDLTGRKLRCLSRQTSELSVQGRFEPLVLRKFFVRPQISVRLPFSSWNKNEDHTWVLLQRLPSSLKSYDVTRRRDRELREEKSWGQR